MNPPVARVEPVTDVCFGHALTDPYRWMEQTDGEEFRSWLRGQAEHADATLAGLPLRAELADRVRALTAGQTQVSDLTMAGEDLCLRRRTGAASVAALVLRSESGDERVLLDPSTLDGAEHTTIDWHVPSPSGRYLACGISYGDSENCTLRVIDAETGQLLPDAIPRVWFGVVSWLDDESLLYHQMPQWAPDAPADQRRLDSSSRLHRLGTDPNQDVTVLTRGFNAAVAVAAVDRPFLVLPADQRWVIAVISHSSLIGPITEQLSDCSIYLAPRDGLADPRSCPWRRVAGPDDGIAAFTASADTLYLVSRRDAPRGRVIAVPLTDPDLDAAEVVVPAGRRVIEAVRVVGDRLLVRDHDGGVAGLRVVALDAPERPQPVDVALPAGSNVQEWVVQPEQGQVLLLITSWTRPAQVYRYRLGDRTLLDTGWLPGSDLLDGVSVRRLYAPARDGTPIPVTVMHLGDAPPDQPRPAILEAYGSYGYALRPRFAPEWLAWFERGGVYAVAHVRGGGEYGREWHEAGRRANKETTIADFIDCAEHLISTGHTTPGLLVGQGGSSGGIPTGGAVVRRPELWAGMVMLVPVTNTSRFQFTENGPANIPENGSITTEDGLRDLLITDSYLRVRDGTRYPAVLLTAGLNDSRVAVWQPAKLAARLQAATSSGRPVLLRIDEHAGHGIGSTKEQHDLLMADVFTFALHACAAEQASPVCWTR